MAAINLNSNLKEIEIIRNGKNEGVIYFDPSDVSILNRLHEVMKKCDEEYKAFTAKAATLDPEQALDEMVRVDKLLRSYMNYAFNADIDEIVFGEAFCFNSKGGVTMLEQFLNEALKICDKEMSAEAKRAEARTNKYLDKYKKK